MVDQVNRGAAIFHNLDYVAFASVAPPPVTGGATHGRPGAPVGDAHVGRILRSAAPRRSAEAAIGYRQRPIENRPVSRRRGDNFCRRIICRRRAIPRGSGDKALAELAV